MEERTALLLRLFDLLPEAICVKDAAGRVLLSNRAHRELPGDAGDEAGKTVQEVIPPDPADERVVFQTGIPVLDSQEPVRDQAGRERWFETSRLPMPDDTGHIGAVLCVRREITERRRKEAPLHHLEAIYHTLIEGLPQRVFFKDAQSAFVSVNAVFAKDLGVPPTDLIGKTDFDLFPRELAEKYRADDRRVMAQRQPEILEEANVSEGRSRTVEVVKVPVVNAEDQVLGLLGIFTDITERKDAEKQLKSFAAKLQRSNRELQDFAYVASHDLQEPLRKVAVFGSRLQAKYREALGAEGGDYLDRMRKATERMQTLINDLLSFARVTTQAKPWVRVNLAAVVAEVLADLETRLEQAGGRVEIGALPEIEADPLQMRQLFQNLIGNALKFRRPEVPPVVRISGEIPARDPEAAGADASPLRGCQITVADNGIGFEDKYAERIFQVFQRLHNRSEYAGSGIGLAICRKIAERHGGGISARGIPGQGATFTLRLPLTQTREDSAYE